MRIAVLASVHPSFSHARAGYVVLASLLEEFGRAGHEVRLFTMGCANHPDTGTLGRLGKVRVTHAGDLTGEMLPEPPLAGLPSDLRTLRKAFLPAKDDDYPKFRDPAAAASRIAEGADAALLFWDTWFEQLIPELGKAPVIGYLARPRTASPISANEAHPSSGIAGVKQRVLLRILRHQEARHLVRLQQLSAATNICALDAAYYSKHGVACDYLPNTWPDFFGDHWQQRRAAAEAGRARVGVLANIGSVNATGNGFGLEYLAREVLPALAPGLAERIEVNVCGGGTLDATLARALEAGGVRVRGFVDDIDGEVLANRIFLLLNNAGPYTGGYTRVIYAFSSGACLVAHRRLADSMPEVMHGENALLGSNGAEIAELLRQAASDPALARRLGEGGRRTYDRAYRPAIIARGLLQRMAA